VTRTDKVGLIAAIGIGIGMLVGVAAWPSADDETDDDADAVPISVVSVPEAATPQPVALAGSRARGEPAQPEPDPDTVADPIARVVPLLYGVRKERQLELLRWLTRVPGDKLVAAIPGLAVDRTRSLDDRREEALAVIGDLIAQLETQGVDAPALPDDLVAAELVGGHAPSGPRGSDGGI
jgi:hypothetical protein